LALNRCEYWQIKQSNDEISRVVSYVAYVWTCKADRYSLISRTEGKEKNN